MSRQLVLLRRLGYGCESRFRQLRGHDPGNDGSRHFAVGVEASNCTATGPTTGGTTIASTIAASIRWRGVVRGRVNKGRQSRHHRGPPRGMHAGCHDIATCEVQTFARMRMSTRTYVDTIDRQTAEAAKIYDSRVSRYYIECCGPTVSAGFVRRAILSRSTKFRPQGFTLS